jgi:predicted ribosomally synthesized peptide with SipW-like signal peptide
MNTIKRITGLALAAMLIASMVAGGVWAYYSDVQTSTSNILLAGTLDLSPVTGGSSNGSYSVTPGGDGVNGKVVFQKMTPGQYGNITWVLTNAGSLNGTLGITSNVTFAKGSLGEIKNEAGGNSSDGNGYLDEYIGYKLQRGVGTDQANAIANFAYIAGAGNSTTYVPLSGLQVALISAGNTVAANGGNDTVVYKLSWDISSLFGGVNPNIIQGDTAQIDITFTLIQN